MPGFWAARRLRRFRRPHGVRAGAGLSTRFGRNRRSMARSHHLHPTTPTNTSPFTFGANTNIGLPRPEPTRRRRYPDQLGRLQQRPSAAGPALWHFAQHARREQRPNSEPSQAAWCCPRWKRQHHHLAGGDPQRQRQRRHRHGGQCGNINGARSRRKRQYHHKCGTITGSSERVGINQGTVTNAARSSARSSPLRPNEYHHQSGATITQGFVFDSPALSQAGGS